MSLKCYFFLSINVKIPNIVGILTFISRKNFMLNSGLVTIQKNVFGVILIQSNG